jgi:hypothetical protein
VEGSSSVGVSDRAAAPTKGSAGPGVRDEAWAGGSWGLLEVPGTGYPHPGTAPQGGGRQRRKGRRSRTRSGLGSCSGGGEPLGRDEQ